MGRSGVAGHPVPFSGTADTVAPGQSAVELGLTNPLSGRSSWARHIRIQHDGGAGNLLLYINGQSEAVVVRPNESYEHKAVYSRVAVAASADGVSYSGVATVV